MTLEELQADNKRLKDLCENLIGTADAMAEGIAMLACPNWADLPADEKVRRTSQVFSEWTERYFNDRYKFK